MCQVVYLFVYLMVRVFRSLLKIMLQIIETFSNINSIQSQKKLNKNSEKKSNNLKMKTSSKINLLLFKMPKQFYCAVCIFIYLFILLQKDLYTPNQIKNYFI